MKMTHKPNKLSVLLAVLCPLSLANCSNSIHQSCYQRDNSLLADRKTLLLRGYSTSFTDGYIDGCKSGQAKAGDSTMVYTKDEKYANIAADYSFGWEQGKSFCYEYMQNLIKTSGSNNPNVYKSKAAIEREKERMWSEIKK